MLFKDKICILYVLTMDLFNFMQVFMNKTIREAYPLKTVSEKKKKTTTTTKRIVYIRFIMKPVL